MAVSETISAETTIGELIAGLRQGGIVTVGAEGGEFLVSVRPATEEMDETEFLLSDPVNAKRLREALARDRSENISFESLDDLKNAVGT
ncbi:MAG: hypothetical protein ACI8UO_000923 [Verrucomicrobiales bacterium]|jgi:hypothetical protein